MPAGETLAPRTWPVHDMLRLRLLPKGEIVGGFLVALSVKGASPFQGVIQITSGEYSIMVLLIVFLHVEIHGTI